MRGKILTVWLIAGLWFLSLAPAVMGAGDEALMPAGAAIDPWKKTATPRVFTSSDLYGYIDGGAELFLEFGFETLTIQKYRYGPAEFSVEIYRLTDPEAAFGIYAMKCGQEKPDPRLHERHTRGRYQLQLVKNRYFIIINNTSGSEALIPALVEFAQAIAPRIAPAPPLKALGLLPAEKRVETSIRLLRGPYALQAVYVFGEGDVLQLAGKVLAASARYDDGKEWFTRIAADYPSAEAAGRALAHLQANLDPYLKVLFKDNRRLLFQDYDSKFGEAVLDGTRLRLTVNLAEKPKTP